ncbi:hypothetical protein CR194_12850 [Salipaludibacillus keqinensis]|uniref:Peptidase M14 domain-containing protein n=1 Tax=Salipaludibacillus keqinensis TaxID=2045207 RepID=A0A323TAH3_9BACI|nr:peptidoglycan-binding protein [Salipaludibacillus keqinensis]PYZ92552.1 hypothetical protein CR194_12850 [Salipaludibacillus keqinensis]
MKQRQFQQIVASLLVFLLLFTSTITVTAEGGNSEQNEGNTSEVGHIDVSPDLFHTSIDEVALTFERDDAAEQMNVYIIDRETDEVVRFIESLDLPDVDADTIDYIWDPAATDEEPIPDGHYFFAATSSVEEEEQIAAVSDTVMIHSDAPRVFVNGLESNETIEVNDNQFTIQIDSLFVKKDVGEENIDLSYKLDQSGDESTHLTLDEAGQVTVEDQLEEGTNTVVISAVDHANNRIEETFQLDFIVKSETEATDHQEEIDSQAIAEQEEGVEVEEIDEPEHSLTDEQIIQLKLNLQELGFGSFSDQPTAHYDEDLTEAVANFQSVVQLDVTGEADEQTLGEIDKLLSLPYRDGEEGDMIKTLKEQLTLLGFGNFPSNPSNRYGPVTTAVVVEFQQYYGLIESGIVTDEVLQLIDGLLAIPYEDGDSHLLIKQLKQDLTMLGFGNFPTEPSPNYGSVTSGVVSEFQDHYGLPITGDADEATLNKISTLLSSEYRDGEEGPHIVTLKQDLSALGFGSFPENPSNRYGSVTAGVVAEFQDYVGLPVSGIADEQTLAKIEELLASQYRDGDEGEHIVTLKNQLTVLGFGNFPSNPSPRYGAVTSGVVEDFQAYYGLPVTGIVNGITLTKINELMSSLNYQDGESGAHIVTLKENLTKLGFGNFPANPSPNYGSVTSGVVKEFQQYYGLTVSGVANELTLAKLDEALDGVFAIGDRDRAVITIKQNLTKLGFGNFPASPSDAYGTVTAGVVKDFQAYYGLDVTGIYDLKTREKLDQIVTSPLRDGQSSNQVVNLKEDLTKLGFTFPANPSRNYGSVTKGKVEDFQQHYGLRVNGIADPVTLAKIDELLRSSYRTGQNHSGVVELKNQLTSLGFQFPNNPSSAYGSVTEGRVKEFQRSQNLPVSGIADEITRQTIQSVLSTQRKIVNGNETYSFSQMERDIQRLKAMYPGLVETKVIGQSLDGRDIHAIRLGKGSTEVFINGSHHAYEHMTTNVNMKMLDEYAYAYAKNHRFDGWNVRTVLNRTSIWFVPMVNPDGVELVQRGPSALSSQLASRAISINGGSTNFSSWKANARGVDLNRQYPALWNTIEHNPGRPSPMNYKGTSPLSEPEAKAVYDFARSKDFKTALSYHSSGEVLFTRHPGHVANIVSNKTGYNVVNLTHSQSGGGFTDWFILNQGKPGLTPEISPFVGPRPVPLSNWTRVWNQNNSVGLIVADEAYQNRNSR